MYKKSICLILLLTCFSACDGVMPKQSWHQRIGWKAEDYFDDPKVIELCKAIEANDLDLMKKLIADGTNVKTLGKGNMTLLLWSLPDNHPKRVRLLLEKGADPNVYITTNLGQPRLFQVGDSVTHMVCRSYFPYFDDVFEFGGDPNLECKRGITKGQTPIITVIKNSGHDAKRRITILLKKGADINGNIADNPFISAITWGGQYDLALFLIENGADYKIYEPSNQLTRGIHFLAQAPMGLLKIAGPQQKADYEKLVKFLEEHGETIEAANKDWARWEANLVRFGSKTADNMKEQEIADRKMREQAEREAKEAAKKQIDK
jgi:uncharacterized protein